MLLLRTVSMIPIPSPLSLGAEFDHSMLVYRGLVNGAPAWPGCPLLHSVEATIQEMVSAILSISASTAPTHRLTRSTISHRDALLPEHIFSSRMFLDPKC